MELWHRKQLDNLTKGIVNEFEFLRQCIIEGDTFYGVALITDEDVMTGFLALSSQRSYLENVNEYGYWEERWCGKEWKVSIGSKKINKGISDLYLKEMYKYYNEIIEFKHDDYEYYRKNFIALYTVALRMAKERLVFKYGKVVEDAIFFLEVTGDSEIKIESSKLINKPSKLLNEMIDDMNC